MKWFEKYMNPMQKSHTKLWLVIFKTFIDISTSYDSTISCQCKLTPLWELKAFYVSNKSFLEKAMQVLTGDWFVIFIFTNVFGSKMLRQWQCHRLEIEQKLHKLCRSLSKTWLVINFTTLYLNPYILQHFHVF